MLALDYGSARCGCALSDPTGTLATPIAPVLRPDTRRGFARVLGTVREHGVRQVVVGLPLGLSGRDTAQTAEARAFAARLAAAIPRVAVELYDERFTTTIASRAGGGRATSSEDSRAAAVLLQDWMTRHGAGGRA